MGEFPAVGVGHAPNGRKLLVPIGFRWHNRHRNLGAIDKCCYEGHGAVTKRFRPMNNELDAWPRRFWILPPQRIRRRKPRKSKQESHGTTWQKQFLSTTHVLPPTKVLPELMPGLDRLACWTIEMNFENDHAVRTMEPGNLAPADGNAAGVAPPLIGAGSAPGYSRRKPSDDDRSGTNEPVDLGPNHERLEDVKPELVHALRELVRQYRQEGVVARRHEIRRIRQARSVLSAVVAIARGHCRGARRQRRRPARRAE